MKYIARTRSLNKPMRRAAYAAVLLLTVQFPNLTIAKSLADLERENTEFQAAFDLMVKQLSDRDTLIQNLRGELSELRAEVGGVPVQLLGCAVEEASQRVNAESFIYDREKTLLNWLQKHIATCKMSDLEGLKRLSNQAVLNQSAMVILREIAKRDDSIPDNAKPDLQLTR